MDPMRGVFQGLDIAASGMRAELLRAEIVAANISNMHVTGGAGRDPYRRKGVVFEEMLADAGNRNTARGVQVGEVFEDQVTPFVPRYLPGHPDADERGWVLTSNVDVFREMVDMMSIERSFQANLAASRTYRNMVRNSITHIGRT